MSNHHDSTRYALLQALASWQAAGAESVPQIEDRFLDQLRDFHNKTKNPTQVPPQPPAESSSQATTKDEVEGTQTLAKEPSPAEASTRVGSLAEAGNSSMKRSKKSKQTDLEVLAQEVAACTLCNELATTRTQTVFGVGNSDARICFFGEAPGADEDKQGEPFVGRAGKLLTKIIEACGMTREDVYILNTLKCRPPNNRNPKPEENTNCLPFFEKQLKIIQPEMIVCLGTYAAQNLLQTDQPIGKLRGKFHDYQGAKVLATYHPAYLLRNPAAKKPVWEDMQMMLQELGLPVPKKTD